MSKISLIVSWFFLWLLQPLAGTSQVHESTLVLHLDKGFYVTGEVVWFKIYVPSRWEGQRFLTLDIFDEKGRGLETFGVSSEGESYIFGYFPIPYEWNTGWYRLRISGVQQKDSRPYELLEAQFPIFNDLKELPENISLRDPLAAAEKPGDLTLECKVQMNPYPANISPGDSLEFSFRVTTEDGEPLSAHASVSVYDLALIGAEVWDGPNVFTGKVFPEDFDVYGHPVVQGALFRPDGSPYLTNFFGAYEATHNWFHYDVSYNRHYFTQHFPVRYGSLEVQFMDFLEDDIDIQLLTLPNPDPISNPAPLFTPGIIEYLQASAKRKKIYKLFDAVETPLSPQIPSSPSNAWKPDRRFVMDTYEEFESLPSFFEEISTPLKFKLTQEGTYDMGMFNPEFGARNFYPGAPLVILNDKLTRNSQFVANLDMDLIDTLDLFFYFDGLREQFGLLGHNGVVRIQTHGPEMGLPLEDPYFAFPVPALLPPLANRYSGSHAKDLPKISPMQYWNAEVEVNDGGVGKVSFVQGDYPGKFLVEICVQTQNGIFGRVQSFYTVQRSLLDSID